MIQLANFSFTSKSLLFKSMFVLIFLTSIQFSSFAQQTNNVSSNSAVINGMTFDYSIGEMTLVSTERNANLIVTQGLLQPISATEANETPGNTSLSQLSDNIKVYPNPTQNSLFVETYETQIAEYSYQLYDGVGKVVINKSGQTQVGLNKFTLDLQSLAAGSYYLLIRKPSSEGIPGNYSFKIQKIN